MVTWLQRYNLIHNLKNYELNSACDCRKDSEHSNGGNFEMT